MKSYKTITLLLLSVLCMATSYATPVVKTGIEVLKELEFAPLAGKRV